MEVIAVGRLTTYPARSKYQIVIERMELAGEGALLKLLEERRKMLAAEGLFAQDRKKELPYLPEVIGIVTSPTGAVIRDILHRLSDRFPRRVLLWPVLVQGKDAAAQVAAAIRGFNAFKENDPAAPRPDLLIVARGGGSLEDLWAFNEEIVVRAAAMSAIPLISAVGHETDTTLIDYASDVRAPTPTAAAEMAVPVRIELLASVLEDGTRLIAALTRIIGERRMRLAGLSRGLPNLTRLVEDAMQRLDDWAERLTNSLKVWLKNRESRLGTAAAKLTSPKAVIAENGRTLTATSRSLMLARDHYFMKHAADLRQASALLESYSFKGVLNRGFALIKDERDRLVNSVALLKPGMAVILELKDGAAGAAITGTSSSKTHPQGTPAPAPKKAPGKKTGGEQGTLL
jgi:exodeoxyribonuclease VII large subunit